MKKTPYRSHIEWYHVLIKKIIINHKSNRQLISISWRMFGIWKWEYDFRADEYK